MTMQKLFTIEPSSMSGRRTIHTITVGISPSSYVYHFCLHAAGQNVVTWSQTASREVGK